MQRKVVSKISTISCEPKNQFFNISLTFKRKYTITAIYEKFTKAKCMIYVIETLMEKKNIYTGKNTLIATSAFPGECHTRHKRLPS